MVGNLVLVAVYLLAPAFLLALCRKSGILAKLGPVFLLYILGIIIGNVGVIPGISLPESAPAIQDLLSNVTVPLAIPLMLLGCTFRRSETPSQLLALLTGLASVVIAVIAGYLIFHDVIDANSECSAAKIGGLLTGVYTGGTINLASLKEMLDVPEETYLLVNGYDMVICFLYLTFLTSSGIKIFRRIIGGKRQVATLQQAVEYNVESGPSFRGMFTRKGLVSILKLLCVCAIVCGLSFLMTVVFKGFPFMTVFMLSLTTFGIAASFIPKLRSIPYSYDLGMYCIYIFSITVASMADFSKIDFSAGLALLGYISIAIFGSLLVQTIFAKLFRLDSDLMVISSVAFICSPPFVPMMAAAMNNRKVIIAGLSIGVVGYAVGNYLGFIIAGFLPTL